MVHFEPHPRDIQVKTYDVVTWQDAFTPEECDKIIQIGLSLSVNKATVGGYAVTDEYQHVRESKTSWIHKNDQTAWIFDRLCGVGNTLNGKHFGFDLWGFSELLQFTVYEGTQESHYTWHMDCTPSSVAPRKLSLVMQLSEPDDYQGGTLEISHGAHTVSVHKKRNLVAAFPSFLQHRVTTVTQGTRYSLVAWMSGPSFR